MTDILPREAQRRLDDYFSRIGLVLGNDERRANFAIYAMGLLGDGERKSVEPIAARAAADPAKTRELHQRLLHFLNGSRWDDHAVRHEAAAFVVEAMTTRDRIDAWIVDDTGFLKQGKHSVGVQRQYTGSAGKVTNCQIGVSLAIASRSEHVPIDFELYLPRSWTDDDARLAEGRIPDDVRFRTKPQLALAMIRRALADGIPPGIVLADTGYGNSSEFRAELRTLKLPFAVAVDSTTKVFLLGPKLAPVGEALSVRDLALRLAYQKKKAFRRCTWRRGTRRDLASRFCLRRVVPFHNDGTPPERRERLWLVCEWEYGEVQPTKYYLVSLSSKFSHKRIIRTIKERWRTERIYEDLKGELGLDHFEGRRFGAWHHHLSVALCCYAFIVAERVRLFPPEAGRALPDRTLDFTAGAPLPGLLHHDAARDRPAHRHLAAALPALPQA